MLPRVSSLFFFSDWISLLGIFGNNFISWVAFLGLDRAIYYDIN